jgi:YD repeat-containing protein
MKRLIGLASTVLLLAAPAFAAGNKPQNVVIPQSVQVGTTQLPAGTYKLAYTGSGSTVQITLTQANKTILTFPAKEVDTKTANPGIDIHADGAVSDLKAIHLSNVSFVLNN